MIPRTASMIESERRHFERMLSQLSPSRRREVLAYMRKR
jgi:hypothetical protein